VEKITRAIKMAFTQYQMKWRSNTASWTCRTH